MATINPDHDWHDHDQRQEWLEQRKNHRSKCLMTSMEFISDVAFADGIPDSVLDVIAQACGKITNTTDRDQIDAAYRTIGRAIADHIAEKAWGA